MDIGVFRARCHSFPVLLEGVNRPFVITEDHVFLPYIIIILLYGEEE